MALKTVLKGLLGTYGVMTTDMVAAMQSDNDTEAENYSTRNIEEAEVVDQTESKPEDKTVDIENL